MSSEPYLEKDKEKRVVKFARDSGLKARKMNGLGNRAWPDQLFLGPRARICFIEFKKTGEKPTKQQLNNHKVLRELGHYVFVADTVEKGKEILKSYFHLS